MRKNKGWVPKFEDEFLSRPGEHLIEIGITGSGKTQCLYWIIDGLLKNSPNEVVVWFDSGKSSEILTLAKLRPLRILIPSGTKLEFSNMSSQMNPVTVIEFKTLEDIWSTLLDKSCINVICIQPYVIDPGAHTKIFATLFSRLISLAHEYAIPVPMTIFVDEFHRLAPSKGNAIDLAQMRMGGILQHNIELLRSLHVRFICSSHGWQKIKSGVRNSFNWIIARRGSHFAADQPKLQRFNPMFEKLQTGSCILIFPTKTFSDVIKLPLYDEGEDLGRIRYLGTFNSPKK